MTLIFDLDLDIDCASSIGYCNCT